MESKVDVINSPARHLCVMFYSLLLLRQCARVRSEGMNMSFTINITHELVSLVEALFNSVRYLRSAELY